MESLATGVQDPILYLYGIVSSALKPPEIDGIERGSSVFLVESGDLACAASIVSACDYDHPHRGDAAAQAEWISLRAWRHHEVLSALHAAGPVLPLKFGSISSSASDIRAMLDDLRVPATELLANHLNKDEWTLKISANSSRVSQHLQATLPALIALREALDASSDGRRYFAHKKFLKATADLVEQHLAAIECAVLARLEPLCAAIHPHERRTHRAADGRHTIGLAAILVERASFDALTLALAHLEAEHAEEDLSFELAGPLPPYTFTGSIDRATAIASGGN